MPQPVSYRGMSLIVPDNDSEWKEFYEHARAMSLCCRAWAKYSFHSLSLSGTISDIPR